MEKKKDRRKMTRILFIGDVHIKMNNLESVDILESKLQRSSRPRPDFIVVAGDILDTHEKVHIQLLNRAYKLIKSLRKIAPVFVIVGNHDYINNQQFLTDNHWLNGMKEWKDVTIVDTTTTQTFGPNTFVFVPFVPPGRFVEALNKKPDWQKATAIFAHQEMKNCKMGAITSTDGDEWDLEWPMLISGHIHDRQQVQPNLLYPGSVINHSFTQDNQGVSEFLFTPDNQMQEHKIDIGLVKKTITYMELKDVSEHVLADLKPTDKLVLSGSIHDIVAFKHGQLYKDLQGRSIKVVFHSQATKNPQRSRENAFERKTATFGSLLHSLVMRENDDALVQDYKILLGLSDGALLHLDQGMQINPSRERCEDKPAEPPISPSGRMRFAEKVIVVKKQSTTKEQKPKRMTKPELLAKAKELGLSVKSSMKVQEIQDLIDRTA